jgi:hypothetical protein
MDEGCAGVVAGSIALADVAVRRRMASRQNRVGNPNGRLAGLVGGIGWAAAAVICLFAWPAAAYRPFDGTDAGVANLNEIEIELQPAGARQQGPQSTLVAPQVVFNYGFADRWEAVLQGQVETPLSPDGPSTLAATGAFLKYVIKPGVLQGQSGISIATEFGPLLPGINTEPGVGFSWAGIVSQRWDWGTAHFNVEANLTRQQHGEVFLDVILEGPATWKVRPVLEVFYDKAWLETESRSALVGAIWQVKDDLSFDAAYRYALVNGRPVNEIRAGVTFAFKVEGDTTPMKPGASFGNWGLSR